MGVTGSGKTTIGKLLASRLGWEFLEGDEFHSAANISKMTAGVALTDEDRLPWLKDISTAAQKLNRDGKNVVVACSALKEKYRDILGGSGDTHFVWLRGTMDTIAQRLKGRRHFMNPSLLTSQFETLETPQGTSVVDIANSPEEIVATVIHELHL